MTERLAVLVEVTSVLPAPPDDVWARAGTLTGVNDEMGPWLRMDGPPEAQSLEAATPGVPVPLRLRGPGGVPLGPYPLTFVSVTPGRGFLERTSSGLFACWEHERTLEPRELGTRVTDRLGFRLRGGLPGAVLAPAVRMFFRHRHRRLAQAFPS